MKHQNPRRWISFSGFLLLLISVASHGAESIGSVLLAKGVVTAEQPNQSARTLARGSEIFLGDTLSTASDSFVVVKMNDGSKISLRPLSEMTLEKFSEEAGKEEALFDLVKGGLRAISGDIGTRRPEEFRVETNITTIGIRGTDFIVRLCNEDCVEEELAFASKPRQQSGPSGSAGGGAKPKELRRLLDDKSSESGGFIECEPVGEVKSGLYAAVLDGGIYLQTGNLRIDLDAIEAAFVEQRQVLCLSDIPHFILNDNYLSANPDDTVTLYNILRNTDMDRPYCEIPGA